MPQTAYNSLKSVFQKFQTLSVIGANWGDEGKGKVIDLVMENYDIVTRFSGGSNAGHTVFTPEGKKLVSHLIPCGLAQNKVCVLSRGEFFNLELFLKELEETKKTLGGELAPIYIDQQAALWTPYHALFETFVEDMRGEHKIGTTNKGIGPLEAIYKLRLSPLVGYLFQEDLLEKSLRALYKVLRPCFESAEFKALSLSVPEPQQVLVELLSRAKEIRPMVGDAAYFLHQSFSSGKRILFEGAQATGLDAWWGTYPYVSSGNSSAAGAALGTGLQSAEANATILVAKTLPTRVGNGPMPSEMWQRQAAMDFAKQRIDIFTPGVARDEFLKTGLEKINAGTATNAEMSQYFQVLGDERGATTGRGRSLGFLDIPWLLYAIRVNNPKWLALTRFDMLSGVNSVPVVTAYKYNGEILPPGKIPAPWQFSQIQTLTETWPGFAENISGINREQNLPQTARDFLSRLEKLLGVPILLVGTGPGRDAMVVRDVV